MQTNANPKTPGPLAAAQAAITADTATADPAIWITRVPDAEILEQARRLEDEGPRGRPLWGLTAVIKDNIDVAGLKTTAACPEFSHMPAVSAEAVRRLVEAGALILGKVNLDQFATGLVGVRSPYGVPRTVFNPAYVPGGSSSGSAVAVAAGICDFALGTDTAGSGRVPAMFGNIVGLKPTVGSVSAAGMVPACRSVDTISIFARSVDAALAVQRVIAFYDRTDPYSRPAPAGFLRRAALPPAIRVAVAEVGALCDPAVTAAYQRTAALFTTETVDLSPFLAVARLLYDGPWVAERTAALRAIITDRPEILHPVTRAIVAGGLTRNTVDAFDAFHQLAQARRIAAELFTRCEALIVPTAPFTPTLAELESDPIGPNSRLGTFTNFVNLCDLTAIAVPAGFGPDGLPAGVTVIGPAWSEGRLAAIADHIHRQTAEALPPPRIDPVQADETPLFCIGAHMAGLPLNPQVTSLGGRFLRTARTQPVYRLHAMGNRPGMVRVASGVSVAGEVWALPTASIGALLAQVPAPLGFGQALLEDGPCLGFVAEAHGVEGTPDISSYGGWRAWLAREGNA